MEIYVDLHTDMDEYVWISFEYAKETIMEFNGQRMVIIHG
jgi:hypothetical protein